MKEIPEKLEKLQQSSKKQNFDWPAERKFRWESIQRRCRHADT
jgi:hypothetical protein